MQMHVDLLIYNTLTITNVAKKIIQICAIYFIIIVMFNFLQSTWIRPQKNSSKPRFLR